MKFLIREEPLQYWQHNPDLPYIPHRPSTVPTYIHWAFIY